MNGLAPPPRWGPLTSQAWPQDDNRVPGAAGLDMPPISDSNAQRSKRESFTMSGSYVIPGGSTPGTVFSLYLATDADGDFWCDQIYVAGWSSAVSPSVRPPAGLISIGDARTGRSLTWPSTIPINFLTTLLLFSDDPGFDPAGSPLPDGYRSTSILPQPFCFTRAGGIMISSTLLATTSASIRTVDIGFGGWKEYENASS